MISRSTIESKTVHGEDFISFYLEELPSTPPSTAFKLHYANGDVSGEIAFSVELKAPEAGNHNTISHGSIMKSTSPQSVDFLIHLAQSLFAEQIETNYQKLPSLDFSCAIYGLNLARGGGKDWIFAGEFTSDFPGPWTLLKVFLGDSSPNDDLYAEFFLALNRENSSADLITKDPGYGLAAMRQLARVLL